MITESTDRKTGITRMELSTVNATACRKEIIASGCVVSEVSVGESVQYNIEYEGEMIQIDSTPTRTIMFGMKKKPMKDYLELIKGRERDGSAWVYDDSKQSDYATKGAKNR